MVVTDELLNFFGLVVASFTPFYKRALCRWACRPGIERQDAEAMRRGCGLPSNSSLVLGATCVLADFAETELCIFIPSMGCFDGRIFKIGVRRRTGDYDESKRL